MAYSSARSIEGPDKPRKVRRKKPSPTTVTATVGAEGQRKTERAVRKAKPAPVSTSSAISGGAGVRRSTKAAKKAAKSEFAKTARRTRQARARAFKKRQLALREGSAAPSASAFTREKRTERLKGVVEGRTKVKTGEEIERERTEALAPTGIRIVRALTGDKPGATTPTLGEAANVLTTLAAGGAGAIAKAPARAKAVSNVSRAAPAAAAKKAVTKAKTAKAVKEGGRAKTAPKRAAERTKARYSAPMKRLRRKRRVEGLTARTVNPITPTTAQTESVRNAAEAHAKAIKEDPVKVAKTTLRTTLGIPAAVGGDVVDLATGNFGDFAKSQKEYVKTAAKLFEGDTEKAKKTILEDVGLVPAITAGLGGYGAVRTARRVGGTKPKKVKPSRARRRDIEDAGDSTLRPDQRKGARDRLAANEYREPVRQRRGNKKRESERSASTAEVEGGLWNVESREGGKRRGKVGPRRTVEADAAELHKHPVRGHITEADTVRLLGDLGISGREKNLVGILKRERRKLRKARGERARRGRLKEIDPGAKSTGAVLDALIANPGAARAPRVQAFLDRVDNIMTERALERARELTGPDATKPTLADEAVRYSGVMRNEGIRTAGERRSPELEGISTVPEGPRLEQRTRASAKRAVRRAKKLEAQGKPDAAAAKRQRGEAELLVINRFRRADNLDRKAAREADPETASKMRAEADELRTRGEAEQEYRTRASVSEARRKVKQTGRREPIYMKQSDVTDPASSPNTGVAFTRAAKKEQFRTGELARQGRVDESILTVLTNLRAQRAVVQERGRQRGFVEEQFLKVNGQRLGTREEWARRAERGHMPEGYELVPLQEFAATIQRTPGLRREVSQKRLNVQATGKGTVYGAAPRSAIEEFRAQAQPVRGGSRLMRNVARVQGITLLVTSPAWFAFQLVATPLVMAYRNPNPVAWARAGRSAVDTWRKAPPRTRVTFNGMFGGNPMDFLVVGENVRGVAPHRVADMKSAMELSFRSPVGRGVRVIAKNLREGGPLIKANRRIEAQLRVLTAHMEMDRKAGLTAKGEVRPSAKAVQFVAGVARATDTVYEHMGKLEGKAPHERVAWYNGRPKEMRKLETAVNDAIGNWSAMTARERAFSGITIFYPFIRFSLRWMTWASWKDSPIKAAIALNLSQSNAQELEELLGGPPGFFQGWGQVVTHLGDDKQLINVARAAPGGNAFVETIGGSEDLNLSTFTRPLQPAIGVVANALDNKDVFGNPREASTGQLLGAGAANLNPLTRPLRDKAIPPSEISQLFRAIEGRDGGVEEGLIPDLFPDVDEQRKIVRLGKLLDTTFAYQDGPQKDDFPLGSPERKAALKREEAAGKAYAEIDKLMVEYGIETKAKQKKDKEQAIRRKYGPPSSSSGGGGWYGGESGGKAAPTGGGWYGKPSGGGGGSGGGWYD